MPAASPAGPPVPRVAPPAGGEGWPQGKSPGCAASALGEKSDDVDHEGLRPQKGAALPLLRWCDTLLEERTGVARSSESPISCSPNSLPVLPASVEQMSLLAWWSQGVPSPSSLRCGCFKSRSSRRLDTYIGSPASCPSVAARCHWAWRLAAPAAERTGTERAVRAGRSAMPSAAAGPVPGVR